MNDKPMSVLIIEDDEIECEKFIDYAKSIVGVKIVATTNSSDKGIDLFKRHMPEAIVLDIELHKGQGSGIEFLEKVKEHFTTFKPIIVVTTNASSTILYNRLHDEGVDFIFYKHQADYSPKMVVSTLLSLRRSLHKFGSGDNTTMEDIHIETEAEKDARISDMIDAELDFLGISPHLKGRDYIHDALLYMIKEEEKLEEESGLNYLAKVYKRTASSIGRVIQTAINKTWDRSSPEDLEKYYTTKISQYTGVPTPTEFLSFYAEKIKKRI